MHYFTSKFDANWAFMIQRILLFVWCLLVILSLKAQNKLQLDPILITNESAFGNPSQLVDEQSIAHDPLHGNAGHPQTDWFGGWNEQNYPIHAYIDFGTTITLSHVFLYDLNGNGAFTVSYGTPNNWMEIFTDQLENYQNWNTYPINITTRYLRFTMSNPNARIGEIVLYGYGEVVFPEGTCQETPIPFPTPPNILSAVANKTMYETGETIHFQIKSNQSGTVHYRIAPDRFTTPIDEGEFYLSSGNTQTIQVAYDQTGFLLLEIEQNGQAYKTGVGIEACAIENTTAIPSDFNSFWVGLKNQLASIPIAPQVTFRADKSSNKQSTYKILLDNIDGKKVHGWVSIPNCPGPFPAILDLPPFGRQTIGPSTDMANRGAITVAISVHDYDVEQMVPDHIAYKPQDSFKDRHTNYFKGSILGCLRAIDFIFSLEQFDGEHLGVMGVSQGGGLSIITAGLDNRVKYMVQGLAALSQHHAYVQDQASGFPYWLKTGLELDLPQNQLLTETAYYDVAIFASQFQGPSLNAVGYNDDICPPATVYAAYNNLIGPKQMLHGITTAHNNHPDFWPMRIAFWETHLPLQAYPNCETLTSFPEREKERIKIFPNPSQDKIWIHHKHQEITSIRIFDHQGTLKFQDFDSSIIECNTQNWAPGLYVIYIQTSGHFQMEKLVIL